MPAADREVVALGPSAPHDPPHPVQPPVMRQWSQSGHLVRMIALHGCLKQVSASGRHRQGPGLREGYASSPTTHSGHEHAPAALTLRLIRPNFIDQHPVVFEKSLSFLEWSPSQRHRRCQGARALWPREARQWQLQADGQWRRQRRRRQQGQG